MREQRYEPLYPCVRTVIFQWIGVAKTTAGRRHDRPRKKEVAKTLCRHAMQGLQKVRSPVGTALFAALVL